MKSDASIFTRRDRSDVDLSLLKPVLEEIRAGKIRPIYAFVGDRYLVDRAARALIELLVPASDRSWNVERYEGEHVDWGRVANSARTPGFGPGPKILWLSSTGVLASTQTKTKGVDRILEEWAAGRRNQAASHLMALLTAAGWASEELESLRQAAATVEEQTRTLGRPVDDSEWGLLETIFRFAVTERQTSGSGNDSGEDQLANLLTTLAPKVVLLLTEENVDQRRHLWRKICQDGFGVVLAVERERSQALSRGAATSLIREIVASNGKALEPQALEILVQRAGVDVQQLVTEVEKLCLWVGERAEVRADDVYRATTDLAESWVFDFTAALSKRDLAVSLRTLRDLLGQGEQPLRLVYLVARELRNLLTVREYVEGDLLVNNNQRSAVNSGRAGFGAKDGNSRRSAGAESRPPRWSAMGSGEGEGSASAVALRRSLSDYRTFCKALLPRISSDQMAVFGKPHPFVLFKRFQDALAWSSRDLCAALLDLQRLDMQLKTLRVDARFLLEDFVLQWCRRPNRSVVQRA
ncbi:MAG: hypothetical protein N3C12_06150 [Candidatus Binatia bacterium]|nr:hypothetical protein [Candidatus Binatia bacterium]